MTIIFCLIYFFNNVVDIQVCPNLHYPVTYTCNVETFKSIPLEDAPKLINEICEKYNYYTIHLIGLSEFTNPLIEQLDPKITVIT